MARRPERPDSTTRRLVLEPAAYYAVRAAMLAPQIAGPGVSGQAAEGLGRWFGGLRFNRRRVERAIERLSVAMPGLGAEARHRLVMRSYGHLAKLACEVAVVPRLLTQDSWTRYVDLGNLATGLRPLLAGRPSVLITGHCGNWELIGYMLALLGFDVHALYRPLDLRPLDRYVRETRARRGLELVDKFGAMTRLPEVLARGESAAFVADQNAGDRGLFVPYLGRLASSYKSIALLTMRHEAVVIVGQARRLEPESGRGAMRYRLELHDIIWPDDWREQPDPVFYITARYRWAIERMVRSAPEQYLWMHRIWKSRPRHERLGRPFPPSLREKLESLPWLGGDDVERLIDRSDRDARLLAELGTERLP